MESNTILSDIMLFVISKYSCPLIERKSYLFLIHFVCNVLFWYWWFQNLPMWCPSSLAFIAHNLFNMWISSWWLAYHLDLAMAYFIQSSISFQCFWHGWAIATDILHYTAATAVTMEGHQFTFKLLALGEFSPLWYKEIGYWRHFPPALFFFTWEIIHTFLRITTGHNVLVNVILDLFSCFELWWSSLTRQVA